MSHNKVTPKCSCFSSFGRKSYQVKESRDKIDGFLRVLGSDKKVRKVTVVFFFEYPFAFHAIKCAHVLIFRGSFNN